MAYEFRRISQPKKGGELGLSLNCHVIIFDPEDQKRAFRYKIGIDLNNRHAYNIRTLIITPSFRQRQTKPATETQTHTHTMPRIWQLTTQQILFVV